MRWLDLTLASIAENVALDEALLIEVDRGHRGSILRFWESPDYAVVMGASRRVELDVFRETCATDGIVITRRTSGGGTVLVGPGALNVAVAAPFDEIPGSASIEQAQRHVMNRIASAIAPFVPAVEVVGSGDLAIQGRKFAGSAQRRLRSALMVHCSILAQFDLGRVARYLPTPPRQPEYRQGRSHHDFLVNLDRSAGEIREAIKRAWAVPAQQETQLPTFLRNLVQEKFGEPDWIFRL